MIPEKPQAQPVRAPGWTRLDSLMLLLIAALAAVARAVGLKHPAGLIFDEFYYGPDACRYVAERPDLCGTGELTYFHPPLGKWLISLGIQLFGPNRLGWRAPAVVFGTLTVVVLYLLGRKLLGSTVGASVAAGLLALDFMHIVHSRLAMLDIYVPFFILLAVLFAVYDRGDQRTGFFRPWRLACGAAVGAATAVKWSGLAILPMVVVIVVLTDRKRRAESGSDKKTSSLASILVCLALVPFLMYTFSYAGRLDGSLFALPWDTGSWINAFIQRQSESLGYQAAIKGLVSGAIHPYSSPAWTWLFLKRPMVYFFAISQGRYQEILAFGNPFVWWASIGAVGYTIWVWLKAKRSDFAAGVIVGSFALMWLPWFVLSTGGPDPYIFYLLPAIPFMCLALGLVATRMWPGRLSRILVAVYLGVVLSAFVFFYPLLTARPVSPDGWRARIWFASCRYERTRRLEENLERADLPIRPRGTTNLPPGKLLPNQSRGTGWCWI